MDASFVKKKRYDRRNTGLVSVALPVQGRRLYEVLYFVIFYGRSFPPGGGTLAVDS